MDSSTLESLLPRLSCKRAGGTDIFFVSRALFLVPLFLVPSHLLSLLSFFVVGAVFLSCLEDLCRSTPFLDLVSRGWFLAACATLHLTCGKSPHALFRDARLVWPLIGSCICCGPR